MSVVRLLNKTIVAKRSCHLNRWELDMVLKVIIGNYKWNERSFVVCYCFLPIFPLSILTFMITFFFSVKHIYLPSLKILYQPNGGDLRVPPRRSNIFVHCHVCCTHHWVAKQVNKVSPHYTFSILPLKPWRASHRFDLRFFFSPAWAPLTRFWFKMFDRLAGNLESSVSFFC